MLYNSIARQEPLTLEKIVGKEVSEILIKEVDKGCGNDFTLTIEYNDKQLEITSELINSLAKENPHGLSEFSLILDPPFEDFSGIAEFLISEGDKVSPHTKIAYYYKISKRRMENFINHSEDLLQKYCDNNFSPPQYRVEIQNHIEELYKLVTESLDSNLASNTLCSQIYNLLIPLTTKEKFFKNGFPNNLSKIITQFESINRGDVSEKNELLFGDGDKNGVLHELMDLINSIEKIITKSNPTFLELEEMLEILFHQADISKCDELEEDAFFSETLTEFIKFYLSNKDLHCNSLTNLSLMCLIDSNVCPSLNYVRSYKLGFLSTFSLYRIFSIICIVALLSSETPQLGWLWLIVNISGDIKDIATTKALQEVLVPVLALELFPRKGFKKNLRFIVVSNAIENLKLVRSEIEKNFYSKNRIGEKLKQIESSGYKIPSAIYELLELHKY